MACSVDSALAGPLHPTAHYSLLLTALYSLQALRRNIHSFTFTSATLVEYP
jgi:hypothetical protein